MKIWVIEFETSDHRPLAAGLELSNGGYYTGNRLTVSPSVEWYVNRRMRLELDYEFNRHSFAETTESSAAAKIEFCKVDGRARHLRIFDQYMLPGCYSRASLSKAARSWTYDQRHTVGKGITDV